MLVKSPDKEHHSTTQGLTDLLSLLELVVGHHNAHSGNKLTAFTKWCPPENGIKTFENAQAAVDLALKRMGQQQIALLQCEAQPSLPPSLSLYHRISAFTAS